MERDEAPMLALAVIAWVSAAALPVAMAALAHVVAADAGALVAAAVARAMEAALAARGWVAREGTAASAAAADLHNHNDEPRAC